MSLERIFKAFLSLDLSETDVRVYIFLALKGPKKAKNIVNSVKINKQEIIRSLKNLQNKGIVAPDTETKDAFSALPFEKALEILIKTKKEQTKMMQEALLSTWKTIKK